MPGRGRGMYGGRRRRVIRKRRFTIRRRNYRRNNKRYDGAIYLKCIESRQIVTNLDGEVFMCIQWGTNEPVVPGTELFSPYTSSEWNNYQILYREYRIKGVKWKWSPASFV